MRAFHNDPALKERILAQLQAHYDADEIIQGKYWENGNAVGCTVHSDNHNNYETELGIPEVLAHLEDYIFERLPRDMAKDWPIRFMRAIPVGADLSKVWPQFVVFLLIDSKKGFLRYAETDEQKQIIQHVADLYSTEREVSQEEWDKASKEARRIYKATNFNTNASLAIYCAVNAAYRSPFYDFSRSSVFCVAPDEFSNEYYYFLADKLIELLSACKNK